MSVAKTSADYKVEVREAGEPPARRYGVPSWLLFAAILLINVAFFVSQLIVNGVRDGTLEVATLDRWLYPGAYWFVASSGVAALLLSGLFLGLTLALLVVRAWMHQVPCRFYGVMLGIQILPWVYFFSAL